MAQTTRSNAPPKTTIVAAFLAGLAVLLLLFPASGVDTFPPVCRSMLGYVVPCDAWVAWVAAAAGAGMAGLVTWVIVRPR